MSDTIDLRPQGAIPVTSLLAPGTPGVEYRLPYPGSSLFWDGAAWVGHWGGGFADLAAVEAATAGYTVGGGSTALLVDGSVVTFRT